MRPMCNMCAGVGLIHDPGCGGGGMRLWLCARMVAGVVCGSRVFWVGSGFGMFSVMAWILQRMLCIWISWACRIEAKWGLVHCVWRWALVPFDVVVCG